MMSIGPKHHDKNVQAITYGYRIKSYFLRQHKLKQTMPIICVLLIAAAAKIALLILLCAIDLCSSSNHDTRTNTM